MRYADKIKYLKQGNETKKDDMTLDFNLLSQKRERFEDIQPGQENIQVNAQCSEPLCYYPNLNDIRVSGIPDQQNNLKLNETKDNNEAGLNVQERIVIIDRLKEENKKLKLQIKKLEASLIDKTVEEDKDYLANISILTKSSSISLKSIKDRLIAIDLKLTKEEEKFKILTECRELLKKRNEEYERKKKEILEKL